MIRQAIIWKKGDRVHGDFHRNETGTVIYDTTSAAAWVYVDWDDPNGTYDHLVWSDQIRPLP